MQGDTTSSKLLAIVLEHAFKRLDWDDKGITTDGERTAPPSVCG